MKEEINGPLIVEPVEKTFLEINKGLVVDMENIFAVYAKTEEAISWRRRQPIRRLVLDYKDDRRIYTTYSDEAMDRVRAYYRSRGALFEPEAKASEVAL